jgi:dihydrolipoamide dehydrogenase
MADQFDVVIIGAGPGGYVAAIRATQLGLNTAIVEREYFGGVCLNWGCIPSKTLLYATELKRKFKEAGRIGLKADNVDIDLDKLRRHKNNTVRRLTGGVRMLMEKSGVTIFEGTARFLSSTQIEISGESGQTQVDANNIIIATGARPMQLPMLKQDGRVVIGAREAIDIPRVPTNMLVVGAGPIGVELATVYRGLGAKVTIVELLDAALPMLDADVSAVTARALKKQGIKLMTSSKVLDSKVVGDTATVKIQSGDTTDQHEFDCVLVAAGMIPNTDSLDLNAAGVEIDPRGFLDTDEQMRTNVKSVYAIGDVAGGILLAHKASHEGIVAVETIAGKDVKADWNSVPYAVFCDPEVAGIGLTQVEAEAIGDPIKVGMFPYSGIGKAVATLAVDGFAKVITDAATDKILGVHIVGPHAGDIILAGTAMIEQGGTAEDLGHLMAIHPTLSEALMESALHVNQRAIHIAK